MWETVLSIMAAACCLRRKKPKARQGSTNRVTEVAREELEEAEDSAEWDETEEEESDSGETAISLRSQTFETVPDKLFDYGLNRLPPELESLDPSDFLEQPEQMNLALLPKTVLARICEMLPPKDFGRLSQTCRLMHWRMMKWCQCTVKELDIEVRGWESNDEWRIEFSPKMTLNIQRKQLSFDGVNLFIWIGNFPTAYLFMQLASIFEGCRNIKNLEITAVLYAPLYQTSEDVAWIGELLRSTRARRITFTTDPEYLRLLPLYENTRVDHDTILPIYKEQQGRRPTHKDIAIREPYEIYLMDVPVTSIEQMIRYFLDVEEHGIRFHQYFYDRQDRKELDASLGTIVKWAASSRGMRCYWGFGDELEKYVFVHYPSPAGRSVILGNVVLLAPEEFEYGTFASEWIYRPARQYDH